MSRTGPCLTSPKPCTPARRTFSRPTSWTTAGGQSQGLSEVLLDRLLLTPQRLESIAGDVRGVASLPDPVGEVFDMRTLPNGLVAGKKRVPLGVIGSIYESRPNVTVDISALCLKSGNACILRGWQRGDPLQRSSGEADT